MDGSLPEYPAQCRERVPDYLDEAIEAVGYRSGVVVDEGDLVAGAVVAERSRYAGTAVLNATVGVEHAGFDEPFSIEIAHRTFAVVYESMVR